MNLDNNNKQINNSPESSNSAEINAQKLYNLLFIGKISIKEYINAVFSMKNNSRLSA
jgi:hypothetical protein